MLPKVIIHNAISVDGSILGFPLNMETYYGIASSFGAQAMLVGSATASTGLSVLDPETESDLSKPEGKDMMPWWVIPDTGGRLQEQLHMYRKFEFCRDVIILTCGRTPISYIEYLEARDYNHISTGADHINIRSALGILADKFDVRLMFTDSGGLLSSILLKEGLADKLSLLLSPHLIGETKQNLFRTLDKDIDLKLANVQIYDEDYIHILYDIINF